MSLFGEREEGTTASKMSLSGGREEGTTDSKMSLSGEIEEETTASKMSLSGEREEGTTASKMSLSGGREEGTTDSKMSLSGEIEEETTASKMSLSGEREEGTTASKMTQYTSSKCVQKPRAESPTTSLLSMKSDQPPAFSQEPLPDDNKEVQSLDSEDVLKITHNLLDRRSQSLLTVQQDIKAKLKHKYQHISEGIGHHGNQSLFKDIYTDLYITEGGSGGVSNEHEVRQIEMASKKLTTQETPIKCNDIFKPLPGQDKPIRTVLTKGIAGIGKTVSGQKFILDWAEGKANQDVHFMFPLPFRDLNLKKDQYSLMQLLSHYFSELKEIDSIEDGETKTVFIFDGLDECRLPLDFKNNEKCCDVTEPTSVDVLLTNLIKGNLLPSALIWITSRPAAANQIPPECVDQVTEVRGFNDPQKEEYFRKKIPDQNLANEIIKHMKTSRSLHIMCHMPVFCWISATVLEMILKEAEKDEVPKTLTQMYSHFMIQIIVKNRKYNKATETNPKELSQSDKEMILKLAKLAFQQLQKGNLIFYEEDLRECGLDVTEASEYSALCTEIFKEESGLYQDKVYSFVHLSIQEFLAAVHALESCLGKKENVFYPKGVTKRQDYYENSRFKFWSCKLKPDKLTSIDDNNSDDDDSDEDKKDDNDEEESIQLSDLHRSAVDQALKSEIGHLDLFLRFLLGLSLESNQNLLRGLLTQTGCTTQTNEETVERTVRYLTDNINQESSPERIINLFHCLNELDANSLVEDMQTSLRSGTLSETELKPDQCSALAYLLLMSEEVLEEFDLKTYNTSEEGYQRLLPVVRTCKRALLDGCKLTYKSCETLASALQTPNSPLRELDLSYNDLGDRGVELLCVGLTSPLCNIQTLVLGQCGLTEGCCSDLASVLSSPSSQLKQLELRDNDLQDSGVTLLSAGLKDPDCKLHTLGLSGCLVTEEGCAALSSALSSNPSHLKELDLSYNHPGDSAGGLLSAALVDPTYKRMKLNVDHGGECRLKSGLRKYACYLTLDPNTPHPNLRLSEGSRKVTRVVEDQHYEDHPDRFDCHCQVVCSEVISGGRYYWELERDGDMADIGVVYKGMKRKGREDDSWIGLNRKSWCLYCYDSAYEFIHAGVSRSISGRYSHRVGVYLDWPAGTLSFYSVSSSGTLTHLHTEHTTFTEPLYPGFGVYSSSSVTLCQIDDQHIQRDHGGESWTKPGPENTRDHRGESWTKPGPENTRDHCGESWTKPGPENTRDHRGESWTKPGPENTRDHRGESWTKPGPENTRDHGGEFWIKPGPEDTRDHGGESWTKPGPEDNRDHGGECCIKPGPEDTRDHGGECCIKPGPEDTRDHGGECCIKPGPEDTRDHGGECCIKPGPEDTRDHGGESCIKSGPEKWIPQSCKTCDHVEDSTHWLQIEPLTSTVQGVTMFRHRTPKGSYECTVSGLRWLCERDVILKYHFRNWEPYSQLLKDMQYTQGGPLLDITMELGELEEVHLPHFVCLGTNPSLRNEMKILHVEEHGVSLEEVHEVTRFHVKILHPKFSPIALILRLLSWNVDVHCELMLYLTVKRETLISRLYLFPWNPGQIQAVEQQEKSYGSSRFLISRPEQSFKLYSFFRLNIPCSTSINPQRIHLIQRDTTPSFFKAIVKITGIDIEMELFGDDERTAWKEKVSRYEYISDTCSTSAVSGAGGPAESSLTGSAEQQLRSVRTEFVKRVSGPVLNELLDRLLQHTVINQEDMESVKGIAERAEKARDIIDMVLRKGTESCSRMINLLGEMDPNLWSQLQISVGVPT
uniref:NACHT, LRR and PYD domains-containing protein 12-like n=1 Tax=Oncorhynchus kisutch TaxID=8019 RepID=A0A8C7I8Q4_ONCKI